MQPDTPKTPHTPEQWARFAEVDMETSFLASRLAPIFRAAMEQAWLEGARAARDAVDNCCECPLTGLEDLNPYRAIASPTPQSE